MAVAHYLEALAWQREAAKLHAIFGGKNPHPNFVVGGVASPIDLNSDSAINSKKLAQVQDLITLMRQFVAQVYVPDTIAIAGFYKDWSTRGEGLGNFLCYGDLPEGSINDPDSFLFPRGAILNRDLSKIEPVDLVCGRRDPGVHRALLVRLQRRQRHRPTPVQGRDRARLRRPRRPRPALSATQRRRRLFVAQVAALEQSLGRGRPAGTHAAAVREPRGQAHEQAKTLVDYTLGQLELPVTALFSTLGRTAARTLESQIVANAMQGWYDQLVQNIRAGDTKTFSETLWDPSSWPNKAQGAGFMEAPRGALGHWIVIEDGKIANYQAVVPSTWNAGPRDPQGIPGAYEAALADNTQLHDPKQPIEILRTIHSFDPCIACAVHLSDPETGEAIEIKVS